MRFDDVAIPAGLAWSSPFAKWQGSLAEVSSLDLAAAVTTRALADRGVDVDALDGLVLGWTIPQPDVFYGAPTLAGRIGAPGLTGPMVAQACATSVAALVAAAGAVSAGSGPQLVVTTDRTSNGPTLLYPQPSAMGGSPRAETWVLDSFGRDPWAGTGMLTAGETVARKHGITRGELDDLTVLRSEQYQRSLSEDRAFARRYQVTVEIPARRGPGLVLEADEGIRPAVAEQIAKLAPVDPDGVHTFASQTHPADGCAGAVVTTVARARELSGGHGVVRLLAAGTARVAKTHMPEAPVPRACGSWPLARYPQRAGAPRRGRRTTPGRGRRWSPPHRRSHPRGGSARRRCARRPGPPGRAWRSVRPPPGGCPRRPPAPGRARGGPGSPR